VGERGSGDGGLLGLAAYGDDSEDESNGSASSESEEGGEHHPATSFF